MATASCTIIGQNSRGSYGDGYSTSATYVGYGSSKYYDYRMKFETPAFKGKSPSLSFDMLLTNSSYSTVVLHYALCTSDENVKLYQNTLKDVTTDPYQIASGVFTCNGVNKDAVNTLTINASDISEQLLPSTTYYLFLWTYENTSVSPAIYKTFATVKATSSHSAYIEYDPNHTVRIMYYKDFADGTYQIHLDTNVEVEDGEYFVPGYCSPPEGYDGGVDSTFNAYEAKEGGGWTKVCTGIIGVDGFYVNKDMLVQTHMLPYFDVYELHQMMSSDGTFYQYSSREYRLKKGTQFTPSMITPPDANTTEEVAFEVVNLDTSDTIVEYEEGRVPGDYYLTIDANMQVSVFYKALHTVTVKHYAVKSSANYEVLDTQEFRVINGHSFTPDLIEPPLTNTVNGVFFGVFDENGEEVLSNATPGDDYFTVVGDYRVEVNYPLLCSIFFANHNGTVVTCRSHANYNMTDVLVVLHKNVNGTDVVI